MTRDPIPPAEPWWADPLEVDRTLDGELPADVLAGRRAEVAADDEVARLVGERAAFLALLQRTGAQRRAQRASRVPAELEHRVRAVLGQGAGRPSLAGLRWVAAIAAVLVLAVLVAPRFDTDTPAEAMPPEVLKAAQVVHGSADGPRGCADDGETSPQHFPPVKEGALKVWRCIEDEAGTVAKLYRPEDLPSVGYVAVAERGAPQGPTIGMTDLGDLVVYDLVYGRQRHYLAVSRAFLTAQSKRTPGRESCAACHNRSRDGQANPHTIIQRSWELR